MSVGSEGARAVLLEAVQDLEIALRPFANGPVGVAIFAWTTDGSHTSASNGKTPAAAVRAILDQNEELPMDLHARRTKQ